MLSLPPQLLILTLFLVILPTIIAVYLRFLLYKKLNYLSKNVLKIIDDPANSFKPRILEKLEARFKTASVNIEQVNTSALIDQIYSYEKLGVFSYEDIDYLCQILPNLLLAFGLLGTFFGITMNLASLSQIINQNTTPDVNTLIERLQQPLEGMGIAFTTSLTGLFCSAFLTIFAWIFNTKLAKFRLINLLEDYLDNIYQSTIQGNTRLDKAVNRMVEQQHEFLTRFHANVTEAISSSLGDLLSEIYQGNSEVNELAKEVYQSFNNASGTIGIAANDLRKAVDSMSSIVARFEEVGQSFERGKFPEKLAEFSTNLQQTQAEFSKTAISLNQTLSPLSDVVPKFDILVEKLSQTITDIEDINKLILQSIDLQQNNHHSLGEIIPNLKVGAELFNSAVEQIKELQKNLDNKTNNFNNLPTEIGKLVATVKEYIECVSLTIESLGDRIIDSMSAQVINQMQNSGREINLKLEEILNKIPSVINNNIQNEPQKPQQSIKTREEYAQEYQQAIIAFNQNKNEEALIILDLLIKDFPSNARLHLLRGQIFQKIDRNSMAEQCYKLVLELTNDQQLIEYANIGLSGLENAEVDPEIERMIRIGDDDY